LNVCITIAEDSVGAVSDRMAELAPLADLFEVRADFLSDPDLAGVLRARTRPILLTCRPESEGGRFPDRDHAARRRILTEAVSRGFDLVDVEFRSGFADVIAAKAGRGLVLSTHDFAGAPKDLDPLHAQMARLRPDVVKVAVTARSVADLGRLLAFARRRAPAPAAGKHPELVAIAMGPLGVASRILGGTYGAPFTFAAPDASPPVAPGQLGARVLGETYRVRQVGPATRVYGVVGQDVVRSLSPAIHNAAFAATGRDAVYVPLQSESLEAFIEALPGLGLSGFSVTRPYKQSLQRHLAQVEETAARAGSVNTVVVRDGRLCGSSTDGDGVLVPLRKRTEVGGRRVLIVGAGGAARAAAFALVGAGARVSVLARRPEQAAEVAAAAGGDAVSLEDLGAMPWDVLLHATPVGSGSLPGRLPVPESVLRPGSVVFDMVYEPRPTALLEAARTRGCRTIDGVEMLVAQAVGQFEAWTGEAAPVEAMTRAALGAITEATRA
jgi:3-dehydroquinate dehydratase/shikimate dehydrogenase